MVKKQNDEPETIVANPMPTVPESGAPAGKLVLALVVLLLLVAGGGAVASYYYYRQAAEVKANPQKVAAEQNAQILTRISRHIILPDEEPTLLTVVDPEKIKEQVFFAKAQKGDYLLLYPKALKAYLYNPVSDKVVEVAPINIGGATAGTITP